MALKKTAIIELLLRDKNAIAGTQQLKDEFSELNVQVENFGSQSSGALARFPAKQRIQDVKQLSTSFKSGTKNVKGTGTAVMNLGRIIQDAPFGVMGVANNIEPFLTSFQNMGDEATTTGQKVKGLVTSAFTGGTGLITIASIAGAALTAIQMGLFDMGEEAEEVEEKLQGVIDRVNRIVELQKEFGAFEDDQFSIQEQQAQVRELTEEIQRQDGILDKMNEKRRLELRLYQQGLSPAQQQRLNQLERELVGLGEVEDVEERIKELEDERLSVLSELQSTSAALADSDTEQAEQQQLEKELAEDRLAAEQATLQLNAMITDQLKKQAEERIRARQERQAEEDTVKRTIDAPDTDRAPMGPEDQAAAGSIADIQNRISAMEEFRQRMDPASEGFKILTENINRSRDALQEVQGEFENTADSGNKAAEQNAAALGRAAAAAISHAGSVEEAGKAIVKTLINELITRAILAAFQPPTPASLALAPIFAASAQKLITSLIGFRSGVDDFQGGMARVHKDEMIVNMPAGSNVLTNQNVRKLDRIQRQAGEGASTLAGVNGSMIRSSIREGVIEGMSQVELNPQVSISQIDRELERLRKYKELIGN